MTQGLRSFLPVSTKTEECQRACYCSSLSIRVVLPHEIRNGASRSIQAAKTIKNVQCTKQAVMKEMQVKTHVGDHHRAGAIPVTPVNTTETGHHPPLCPHTYAEMQFAEHVSILIWRKCYFLFINKLPCRKRE